MDVVMTPSNVELKSSAAGGANLANNSELTPSATTGASVPSGSDATRVTAPTQLSAENTAMIETINNQLAQLSVGVAFSVDESSRASVVKLIDRSTSEVVKQYPNDEALKVMRNIQAFLDSAAAKPMSDGQGLTGALFNEII